MIFEIRGIRTATGQRIVAKVDAATRDLAIERLARRGIEPLAATEATEPRVAARSPISVMPEAIVEPAQLSTIRTTLDPPVANDAAELAHNDRYSRKMKRLLVVGSVVIVGLAITILVIVNSTSSTSSNSVAEVHSDVSTAGDLELAAPAPPSAPTLVQPLPVNVIRSNDGKLVPAPGYAWLTTNAGDFAVRWLPGARHPNYANIASSEQEGYWSPDPGYGFISKESLLAQWRPGTLDPRHAHVVAGDAPNKWRPSPGYTWAFPNDPDSYSVAWQAGIAHPSATNVVSSQKEGVWRPITGYKWANDVAGDFTVVRAGPSEEQLKSAISKVIIALLADKAGAKADDGSFFGALASEGMKELRNEAIRSALNDLFPSESHLAIAAAANIIILGADGELTADNWSSRTSQEALVQQIRAKAPSVADAYQLAEFIGNVMDTYEQRR